MEPLEAKFNIQTSSSSDSIATSFTNIRNYFVSTVNQQKHQPYYPAKYSSIIKEAGPSFEAILTIDADSERYRRVFAQLGLRLMSLGRLRQLISILNNKRRIYFKKN